ncbi:MULTISPECIES: ATP-binding protein [unclassified Streptomyces]|uniref:ATP-binding protein n=1 Tax=unclassified Streptomyces TaxID=2593676 RepID=UPI00278BB9C5|nr:MULTISPECIES: ATP-binding protein [unclassified Streptomyces]
MSTALPTLDRSTGYPLTPRSVPLARMHTRRRLTFWQWTGDIDDAVLVVSELAANAVTHGRVAGHEMWVRLAVTEDGGLLVDVSDPSPVLPVREGRGLVVVRQLALEVEWFLRNGVGKTVRARLAGAMGGAPGNSERGAGQMGHPGQSGESEEGAWVRPRS